MTIVITPVKFSTVHHDRNHLNYKSHYVTHSLNKPLRVRRLQTKKKQEKYWKTPPEVSIVGFSRIRDKNYSAASKFLWFIIICSGVGLCGWQLWDRTKLYYSQPILKNVDIVYDSGVVFPSVYLCPGMTRNLINTMASKLIQNCAATGNKLDLKCLNDSYIEHSIKFFNVSTTSTESVKTMWKLEFLNEHFVHVYKPCKASDVNCTAEGKMWNVNSTTINTFWGGCMILNTVHEEEYRGPFSYMDISIHNWVFEGLTNQAKRALNESTDETERKIIQNSLDRPHVGALLYLNHAYALEQHHLMFYTIQDILQGFRTHVVIRKRVYDMTKGKKASCVKEEKYLKCYNQCLEANLSSTCRMPYSKREDVRDCLQNENYLAIHIDNYVTYAAFNSSQCNCLPPCIETTFIATVDVIDKMPDEEQWMWIKLYFADNVYEKTTEKLAYSLSQYVGDIGGYGGFFLGFCILNILEFLEFFTYILTKKK